MAKCCLNMEYVNLTTNDYGSYSIQNPKFNEVYEDLLNEYGDQNTTEEFHGSSPPLPRTGSAPSTISNN